MARRNVQSYSCGVVHERVKIYLSVRKRRRFEAESVTTRFVQCDQHDCQYVEKNALPCPLDAVMFDSTGGFNSIIGKEDETPTRDDGESLCRW